MNRTKPSNVRSHKQKRLNREGSMISHTGKKVEKVYLPPLNAK